jgi:oligoendopeptidase F
VNETIVTDAALAQASDADEELAILETFLIGAGQVIVDIYSRYLFETEVFERRADAELSADDFCEIMLRTQKETYGEVLDHDYLHKYAWAGKPHYYRPGLSFYNYPYSFGLLFGLGLYAIYQERGADFLPEYDALLRSAGRQIYRLLTDARAIRGLRTDAGRGEDEERDVHLLRLWA